MDSVYETIKGRRSIRRYQTTRIEQRLLERMIEAALSAPSPHNRQPWRWIVVENHERRLALAEAMASELIRTREADGDAEEDIQRDAQRSIERISHAPVALIACLDMSEMDRYPDPERERAEYLMAVQSVAMAGQNFMLLAQAEGLGTCWMCAPLFSPSSVHATFDIPETWHPQGMILVGYPAAPGRERSRKALDEVVRWI